MVRGDHQLTLRSQPMSWHHSARRGLASPRPQVRFAPMAPRGPSSGAVAETLADDVEAQEHYEDGDHEPVHVHAQVAGRNLASAPQGDQRADDYGPSPTPSGPGPDQRQAYYARAQEEGSPAMAVDQSNSAEQVGERQRRDEDADVQGKIAPVPEAGEDEQGTDDQE